MTTILRSARDLRIFLGLPEGTIVYGCERIHGDIFRFKVTGPMNPEKEPRE